MTTAVTINILVSAIVLIAIISLMSWSILTSRQTATSTPAPSRRIRHPASDQRRQGTLAPLQSQA